MSEQEQMKQPLKVYKASAGSGKTFTLAIEFIKLLTSNPLDYKHILAVTFTNKATAEMKTRILSQLYGIAHSLTESDVYYNEIANSEESKKGHWTETFIRERASMALSLITHDYSRFRIETIDSFFQSIIRDLAHELDLTANLKLDLNDNEVLEEAVKTIINNLAEGSDTFIMLSKFVNENIENLKNWDIRSEMSNFGKNIFNEQFIDKGAEIKEKVCNRKFLKEYQKDILTLRDKSLKKILDLGKRLIAICDDQGYQMEDFSGKSKGIYAFFEKIAQGQIPNITATVEKCLHSSEAWSKTKGIIDLANKELIPILAETAKTIREYNKQNATVNAIKQHINHLMLLEEIDTTVRSLNNEANRFLLSDTAHFLRDIIDGSDIPFIYEKTGNKFKHIMIDEFQDTSALQWENFKPLLANSLSENNKCLIVGDVKQSIYRWRNSDWSILNNIKSGYFSQETEILERKTNYRSSERVIDFNNIFFRNAETNLNCRYEELTGNKSTDMSMAYNDVEQIIAKKNLGKGYVKVEYLDCDKKKIDENDENTAELLFKLSETSESETDFLNYKHLCLNRIKDNIKALIEKGVNQSDIAILTRINDHITLVTEFLATYLPEVTVVSDEAFRLDASPAINIIISALKLLSRNNDKYTKILLAYRYQTHVCHNNIIKDDFNSVFMLSDKEVEELIPEQLHDNNIQALRITPLYELCEKIYSFCNLSNIEGEDAYLFAFFDKVSAFTNEQTDDIDEFLEYWEDKLRKQTIPNGNADGIRMMSIHKSKGLEFHTVIIPFCDWRMGGKHTDLIWCTPKEHPFDELPLTPVNFTKETKESIFSADYDLELLKNYVDNMNILYVAFTRAKNNLIIIAGNSGNKSAGYSVNNLIKESLPATEYSEEIDGIMSTFCYGEMMKSKEKEIEAKDANKEKTNVLETNFCPAKVKFIRHDDFPEFKQSNKSIKFINHDSEDCDEEQKMQEFIDEGLMFHHLLELIVVPEDIPHAIRTLDSEGHFKDISHRERTRAIVTKAFNQKEVKEWFAPEWEVINECTILHKDSNGNIKEHRPDRVITNGEKTLVIDYKTGKQNDKDVEQVKTYINLLKQMGYRNIAGHIWYIHRNDIINISQ